MNFGASILRSLMGSPPPPPAPDPVPPKEVQKSKDELLYEYVAHGDVESIRALRRDGAGLEWVDQEGRTPLVVACMAAELVEVVRVLIDLGSNVNAFRRGSNAGTPLHHAAKRGLAQTVELLLSSGATPLVMNDDRQTALDLARTNGHMDVVRLIEVRIFLFSGCMRETYEPKMLEAIIRKRAPRKIFAVILLCEPDTPTVQPKYELLIYSDKKASEKASPPNYVIPLLEVHILEPLFNQPDPSLFIIDKATKKRYTFLSGDEGDKQQLQLFYNACRGIPQHVNYSPAATKRSPMPTTSSEDVELAMAPNASFQMAIPVGIPLDDAHNTSVGYENRWWRWNPPAVGVPSKSNTVPSKLIEETPPSAPPVEEEGFYDGPIHYPVIDCSPVDLTVPAWEASLS